jgi:hypothetical protein
MEAPDPHRCGVSRLTVGSGNGAFELVLGNFVTVSQDRTPTS